MTMTSLPLIASVLLAETIAPSPEPSDLGEGPIGVRIHVEILPRVCAEACTPSGPGDSGLGGLAATGDATVLMLLAIGVALLAAGALVTLLRRPGRRLRAQSPAS
ncbi:MAG: LPXTG cell wall anchor domain-containing protein [Actinobacteria bacterium]|nr:LPXTG cell wall anchor domain-containing protein [Actinomycetota bacterium]